MFESGACSHHRKSYSLWWYGRGGTLQQSGYRCKRIGLACATLCVVSELLADRAFQGRRGTGPFVQPNKTGMKARGMCKEASGGTLSTSGMQRARHQAAANLALKCTSKMSSSRFIVSLILLRSLPQPFSKPSSSNLGRSSPKGAYIRKPPFGLLLHLIPTA